MNEDQVNYKQILVRHQEAVKALGILVATLLLLVLGLLPLLQSSGTLLRKIETRQKEEKTLTQKVAILSQIDQEVLKERTKIIKSALPESKDVIAYLSTIDGLSKELGLTFGGITINPGEVRSDETKVNPKAKVTRKVAQLNVLDTDIKINGTQAGIYAFLRSVEQALPLMQVADVIVTKIGEDQYTMSLKLGMLWAPGEQNDLKGAISLFNEDEEKSFQKLSSFRKFVLPTYSEVDSEITGKTDLFLSE